METSHAENIEQTKSVLQTARRVFVLTGAGISAESGVPTFRGGGASVWRGMPFEQLSSAEMVEKDLPLVWEWFDYRGGLVSECEPNAAHRTLAEVQQSSQFEEFSVVTQNIDGLHAQAGAESVIELHGSLWQARCLSCKTKQSLREIPDDERPPVCPECFDSMRPDVILFGEMMPMQAVYEAQEKAKNCDVCIVIGTSALVYPAAELPIIAQQNGAKIIEINPEETPLSNQADVSLRGKAAEILPLIFAKENSSNRRLPDEKLIKFANEKSRKEEQTETAEVKENPSENNRESKISFMTSQSHPLRVDFVYSERHPILNRLGLTFAPGKKQLGAVSGNWDRDLTLDLARLREFYKADTLVSLVEDSELGELGIVDFERECSVQGIELIRFPLKDVSVPPSLESFARLIREIVNRLEKKKTVVVHCKGGLGRAGLTAACAIIDAGENKISGADAIKKVRAARAGTIETREQENFVSDFYDYLNSSGLKRSEVLRQRNTAQKERVLSVRWAGGGKDLFRFKADDGKWYFWAEGSNMAFDDNDDEEWIPWQSEVFETIGDGIKEFISDFLVFFMVPAFVHPEYRAEVKARLENLYANLTREEKKQVRSAGDFVRKPDEWLREADWNMEKNAKREEKKNEGEGRMNSETAKRPFPVPPSSAEYKRGFEAILDRLNDSQLAMLRAHYEAPGYRATVHDLAEKCGIPSWRTVNREYGMVGKLLLEEMGYAKPRNEDGELWLTAICFWYKGMVMYMRPEVVKALQELGIVPFLHRGTPKASERSGNVEPSGTPDGEAPNDLSNATPLVDETEVSSPAPDPSTTRKAKTSEIPPIFQDGTDSKIEKYHPDLGIMKGAKRILVITGKGNSAESAHAAIIQALDAGRELDRERIEDFSLLTRNIDGSYDLVELHGDINEALCVSCGHSYNPENIAKVKYPTDCPKCKDYDVILRGKRFDDDDLQVAREKAITCEFCVVAGSSDVSDSAMRIAEIAKQSGAYLLEINEEETALSEIADGVHLGYSFLLFYFICLGIRHDVRDHYHTSPAVSRQLSDKHFLIYWQERNVIAHEESNYPLDVVSSRQLKRAGAGDTLWLATINQAGELILAGRLKIGEIVDYQTAVRRLNDTSLWDGGFFALPKENEAEFLRRINLNEAAFELRFANTTSDRLVLKNGKINAQQLQTMRQLTEDSAEILARIWETEEEKNEDFTFNSAEAEEEENWVERLERCRQIVRDEPDNAEAHFNLGEACEKNWLRKEANLAYQRAIELDPNYISAYCNLGKNYLYDNKLDKSEQAFKTAIRLAPEYALPRFLLGEVYAKKEDFDKAITVTKEGLEYDLDDPMAYFNLGYYYFHLQNYENAAQCFEKSAELAPDYRTTFYRLGECYRHLGEKQKEFDAYWRVLELSPDFNAFALFALGTAYAHLTETAEGEQVSYFETGGELILSDPQISFYLGLGNLALGNVDEARESENDLHKMDEALASELQFFIDRFDGVNEEAGSQQENADPNSVQPNARKRKIIKAKINNRNIEAKNIPELYKIVLVFLFDNGFLDNISTPVSSGQTRYFLAKEPVHPSGKNFFKPVEYGGFYLEAHNNRPTAIRQLKTFVESLGLNFEIAESESTIFAIESPVKKQSAQTTVEHRFLGSLLGLAACDALGTTVEFKPTGTFPRVTTISGGGPFELKAGEWTDDTSMALCLADSLIESGGFDPVDQMRRYCRWKNEGYLSSNGVAFDIGNTVRRALEKFEQQAGAGELIAYCGSVSPATAGNGSLMRLAPVPLFFANDAANAVRYAGESSRTTHGARECVDACRYFASLIIGAVQGKSKEEILSSQFTPLPGLWEEEPLAQKVAEIALGSFKSLRPPEITGAIQGYVIPSLHAALWAFYHTDNFADGALKVVNLGYDADTYGAIYGQLAGAYYGAESMPSEWLNLIAKRDLIESLAQRLYESSGA